MPNADTKILPEPARDRGLPAARPGGQADLAAAEAGDWQVSLAAPKVDDPLLACLSLLAGLLQRPISPGALSAGLPQAGARLTPGLCLRAAERAGLRAGLVRRSK